MSQTKAELINAKGDAAFDTNTLFVDSTNNRVGVGTTSPLTKIDSLVNTFDDDSTKIAATFRNNQNSGVFAVFQSAGTGTAYGNGLHIGLSNTSNGIINLKENTDLQFNVGNTERARIDSSGRLLVGTSSSIRGSKVQVLSTGNDHESLVGGNQIAQLELCRSSNSAGGAGIVASGDIIGRIECLGNDGSAYRSAARIEAVVDGTPGANDMPGRIVFSTTADGASSPTERLRIDSNGVHHFNTNGVSYGGASNDGCLSINAASGTAGSCIGIRNGSAAAAGRAFIRFVNNTSGVAGEIIHNGNTTVQYVTSSDYRLKENLEPLTGAIGRLSQVPVWRFTWKTDPGFGAVDGFMAHEVQAVVPEAVNGKKDEVDENGDPIYQGIDQSKLVPLLTAALQEAVAKIESLEARLTALESA